MIKMNKAEEKVFYKKQVLKSKVKINELQKELTFQSVRHMNKPKVKKTITEIVNTLLYLQTKI